MRSMMVTPESVANALWGQMRDRRKTFDVMVERHRGLLVNFDIAMNWCGYLTTDGNNQVYDEISERMIFQVLFFGDTIVMTRELPFTGDILSTDGWQLQASHDSCWSDYSFSRELQERFLGRVKAAVAPEHQDLVDPSFNISMFPIGCEFFRRVHLKYEGSFPDYQLTILQFDAWEEHERAMASHGHISVGPKAYRSGE